MRACDPDAQIDDGEGEVRHRSTPTEEQIKKATEELAQQAVTPFLKAAFRRRILEIRAQNEQTIDRHTIDDVLYSGFDASAVEKAQTKVKDFRAWIADHKDELTALQVLYSGTKPLKLSLKDLRQLRDALATPPLAASPTQLWRAFQAVESDEGQGPRRHAARRPRHPRAPRAHARLARSCPTRTKCGRVTTRGSRRRDAAKSFTPEQREWLDRMAEHIATSASPSSRTTSRTAGSASTAASAGPTPSSATNCTPLLAELNERLAA